MEPTAEQIERVCEGWHENWSIIFEEHRRMWRDRSKVIITAWEAVAPRTRPVQKSMLYPLIEAIADWHNLDEWQVADVVNDLAKRGHLTIEDENEALEQPEPQQPEPPRCEECEYVKFVHDGDQVWLGFSYGYEGVARSNAAPMREMCGDCGPEGRFFKSRSTQKKGGE